MIKKVMVKKLKPAAKDKRGLIYDILETSVKHVGYITFVKNAVRGKHYHKKSTQFTYVISGKIELITKDLKPGSRLKKVVMTKGDFALIPPLVIHAYRALVSSEILDMTTESRVGNGYEVDTTRVDLEI